MKLTRSEYAHELLLNSEEYWLLSAQLTRDVFCLTILDKLGVSLETWKKKNVRERNRLLAALLEKEARTREDFSRFVLATGYRMAMRPLVGDLENRLEKDEAEH